MSSTPRVLILGHSFIRRLNQFIEQNSHTLQKTLGIAEPITVHWHGVGGRTVRKTVQYDLHIAESFAPDIVILELGTNDLSSRHPLLVGSDIEELVRLLHTTYRVKVICVCQTIRREAATEAFNEGVGMLTKYLRVVLEPIPYAFFWGHRGFWNPKSNIYSRDGVHLNNNGQFKLYRSLRGAVLKSIRLLAQTR